MGRQYVSNTYFSPNDSNTFCDVTGFKVKLSEVSRRWEGFYVIPAAWNPRQPQDFPVVPTPQKVYKNSRSEQVLAEGAVTPPPIV